MRLGAAAVLKKLPQVERRAWMALFVRAIQVGEGAPRKLFFVQLFVEGPLVAAPLVAALERLRGNATLRRHMSWNARCFWKRHFGHVDDIMRRFVCGLSARQRKSNY